MAIIYYYDTKIPLIVFLLLNNETLDVTAYSETGTKEAKQ